MVKYVAAGILLVSLVWLSVMEWRRFHHARTSSETDYPRARLHRRLTLAGLLAAMLLVGVLFPDEGMSLRLVVTAILLLGVLVALRLIVRDLRETSVAVVQDINRINEESSERIAEAIREERERARRERESSGPVE